MFSIECDRISKKLGQNDRASFLSVKRDRTQSHFLLKYRPAQGSFRPLHNSIMARTYCQRCRRSLSPKLFDWKKWEDKPFQICEPCISQLRRQGETMESAQT
ncbi:hypothetical protein [Phormidesmis sp. 146-20]